MHERAAPLPEAYVPYKQCREYFARECAADPRSEVVGAPGAWGTRWRHGPFRFEKYTTDVEPAIAAGPRRMVIWQRIARQDVPRGWWRAWSDMSVRMTGIATLAPGYEAAWSPHARRHAAQWRKRVAVGEWEIVEPSAEQFLQAHAASRQDVALRLSFATILKEKIRSHGGRVRLIAARRPGGVIEAGLAVIDVPEIVQSIHLMSFLHRGAEKSSAGVGLIDRWFQTSLERGVRFLDFGLFWAPGDPRSWRGFSRFKSQFGVHLIRYPRPLIRFAG